MKNKLTAAVLALFAVAMFTANATASVLTGPVTNPDNGHAYYLLSQNTWPNAEAEAVTLGGHLATINDADENQWVFDTFASFNNVDRNLWIGLNDADEEGTFVWSSGETPGYTKWASARAPQPDDDGSGDAHTQDYTRIIAPNDAFFTLYFDESSFWDDVSNNTILIGGQPTQGVVEVVPEPASLALLGVGGLALLPRRRRRA